MRNTELDHGKAVAEAELNKHLIGHAAVERGAGVLVRQRAAARGELFEAMVDDIDAVRATTKDPEVHEAFNRLAECVALLPGRGQSRE